jgi:predicted DCC family thiol-disulfide oxidoreductase YuxK
METHKAVERSSLVTGESLGNSHPKRRGVMENTQKLILIFDGNCHFCTACIEVFRLLDWRHRLQCLPFQLPDVPQRYGLTLTQCEQAAWAILPSGQTYCGAQAINLALDASIGLPLFEKISQFPGVGKLETCVYAWIAAHRQWFPGVRPYCQRPGSTCGT